MTDRILNSISGRLSLRKPQRKSLEILARYTDIVPLSKSEDAKTILSIIRSEYSTVTDFERDFPSLCFSLATGVGKTRLMGAFISYLHLAKGINHFFVLAPNLTIYNKLIEDFTPNTPKYVFKGISEFIIDTPRIITGDNYERTLSYQQTSLHSGEWMGSIDINIFNISKINDKKSKEGASKSDIPRIRRLSEYIGESYFDYLAGLPDLVLLMDESHRYRASAGLSAINELKPILGLELTATPYIESSKGPVPFKNVIYDYSLSEAMEDGFVKEPAVVTQKNFSPSQFTEIQLQKIKLEDGIRLHEITKVELETYALQTGERIVKPFILVIAKDTNHAEELQKLIESTEFFEGRYKGKAITVHSNLKGEEKEEVVERLLSVEKYNEPTEIVIHVFMLKEGWDVTNLYTIIPLSTANSRTLVEQSIGRGLRLPYGKRTGISAVDRLNIIAHDRFQEIVDEANRSDSPFHLKTLILDPDNDLQKTKTIFTQSNIASKIYLTPSFPTSNRDAAKTQLTQLQPMFTKPEEQKAAEAVFQAIKKQEHLPSSSYLLNPDIQELIVREAQITYQSDQQDILPGIQQEVNLREVVEKVTKTLIDETIDIPRIVVIPKSENAISFTKFILDCSKIHIPPVERDLLIQHLRTNTQETITDSRKSNNEERLEDFIVRGLIDFDDISYDDDADILYDLSTQLIQHFRSYLSNDDEIRNVLLYHQKQLVNLIHAQMMNNQNDKTTEYEVVVSKGFTELKATAYTAYENSEYIDYRTTDFDKSKIGRIIFTGFQKCLYPYAKFDSDTERRFSVILEKESNKWFRPVKGQFGIFYKMGNEQPEYIPDFVAETNDSIYMIETKARNEMTSQEVTNKKEAAEKWCGYASDHNAKIGGKHWKYLLIAHDQVQDNMTLMYYEGNM